MKLNTKVPMALFASLAFAVAGCSDDDGNGGNGGNGGADAGNGGGPDATDATLTSITIAPDTVSVAVNASVQLTVTGTFDDGSTDDVTSMASFESADPSTALADSTGSVFGVAEGSTTVTATVDGITDTVDVTVTPEQTGDATIPMTVDDFFRGRAGFSESGAPLHTEDEMCPSRAGGENGVCHRFVWDGTGGAFTGVFWINGGGFGDLSGVAVDPGATEVSFYAWSDAGGERIEFGAGIPDAPPDGDGAADRTFVTLTDTPTQYFVQLNNLADYTDVYGAFIVAISNTDNPTGATFYVDDIQWTTGNSPTELPLPMTVDTHFSGRSAFGPDGPPLHTEETDTCPARAGGENGLCHTFIWDGTGGGFTGTFWTDGEAFTNLNGKAVEAGATEVSFWAWGSAGGEVIEFGAGIPDAPLDGAADRVFINLTTTPTQYFVSLDELAGYEDVYGAFLVAIGGEANPGGATFYVDDIQWTRDNQPEALTLPMTVDDNYMGRSAFSEAGAPLHTEDDMCPMRGVAMPVGDCHRFIWDGTGGTFTGTFWTDGEGFTDLVGNPVEPGATEVSFYAWGATGGEVIEFGAGIADAPLDGAAVREFITLTTTPTRYFVSLSGLGNYDRVFGPFIVAIGVGDNPSGATFYVDDIQWTVGQAPTDITLPMTIDDHFQGRSGFGPNGPSTHTESTTCPQRAGGQNGDCHEFVWNGAEGFTGTFFTDGNDFMNLNGPLVEAGATELRFWAWGNAGGETITFGAGLAGNDAAEVRQDIVLTTTPTRYDITITALSPYTSVFGPFIWAANNGANPSGATFYVDDIQWVNVALAQSLRPDPEDAWIGWNGGTPAIREQFAGGAQVGQAEAGAAYIIPFVLPTIPMGGFTEANLQVFVIATGGDGSVVNLGGDLYGLDFRTAADATANGIVLTSMFHADATPDASATLIVDNYLTGTTGNGVAVQTDPAGDAALVTYLNDQVTAGAVAGDYVYLRISPDAAAPIGGGYNWVLEAAVDAVAPPNRPTLTVR